MNMGMKSYPIMSEMSKLAPQVFTKKLVSHVLCVFFWFGFDFLSLTCGIHTSLANPKDRRCFGRVGSAEALFVREDY